MAGNSGRARVLAVLYAALGAANSASVAKRFHAGAWATKPLLMPVLTAFTLASARNREDLRLPAAGMILSGLGDTLLLVPETSEKESAERWFIPGMGCFAAAHACYITALARSGAARGVRPRTAAAYGAAWAALISVLWRRLGDLRVPVAAYSLLLVSMAILASGRDREAAAGGALFVVSDALIACGLAGITVSPRQDAAVMPTYLAAQFLLAAGWRGNLGRESYRRSPFYDGLPGTRCNVFDLSSWGRPLRGSSGRARGFRGLLLRLAGCCGR